MKFFMSFWDGLGGASPIAIGIFLMDAFPAMAWAPCAQNKKVNYTSVEERSFESIETRYAW